MIPSSRRPALLKTEQLELAADGRLIVVAIKRDTRARRYTLRVRGVPATPVLTMPMRGTLKTAREFLGRHEGWLKRQLDKAPTPQPLSENGTIAFRGVPHRVRRSGSIRGTVSVVAEADGPVLVVPGEAAHLRRRLFDFLKREAKRDLEAAVIRYAALLEVRPTSVRVRDTFSRWGSCTAEGALSFSFRLIMAPPFVLDYLAAHEVAHLREMNHSRRFWRLVEKVCPESDLARAWLVAYGSGLHAIGAEGND